ncbi:MAG TPA: DUF6603 domain-containing protein [Terriglobales bacterium]|nr:DUF6603 domain-containing protein [Terriglobales bacterium]
MSDIVGTIEYLAGELARLLQPLAQRATTSSAGSVLEWLGLRPPDAAAGASDLATALTTILSSADALPDLITNLSDAIDNSEAAAGISAGAALLERFAALVKASRDAANALQTLSSAPGLSSSQQAELSAFAGEFADRLLNQLFVEYVEARFPYIAIALMATGGIEIFDDPGGAAGSLNGAFTRKTFHFDRMIKLLTSPGDLLNDVYGWGSAGFDGIALFTALQSLLQHKFEVPAQILQPPGSPATIEAFGFSATVDSPGLDLSLRFPANVSQSDTISAGDWQVTIKNSATFDTDLTAKVRPLFDVEIDLPSGTADLQCEVDFARSSTASPFLVLGSAGGSRLELQSPSAGVKLNLHFDASTKQLTIDPELEIGLKGGKLVISGDGADGFIGTLLSGVNIESDFDVDMRWSPSKGFTFVGSAAIQIQLPVHIALGPLEIISLYLQAGLQSDGSVPVELSGGFDAKLGPLEASVDRLGLTATFSFPKGGGNIGPANVALGFKPPSGVGLSIDTGIVVGGGFLYFDPDKGEYAGVAELSIADVVTVKAIGLISTKMPDGSSGFSLLLILTTDFPPIQLGFGFTLNGVGGLLGLNRSVQLDVLRDGVRTGAVDEIVFPTDIIANAPRIISDLKTIFPPQQNVFLAGPMAKFGWGDPSLVTLSLGIIVEIPPANIAILGVLQVALPTEDEALILIQVAFLGILDFDEQLLSFDASLYDSHILFMTLEGDMAVRLKWGDNAAFILSVGGFHPAFHPPDGLHLPASMKRLTMSILDYDWAKIKVDCYFAVTSNTVQFGAHLYVFFGVDAANITGQLGLDVLFQFSPFMFIAQMSGSLSIAVFGMDLLSISLNFQLSGPTPWEAKGTGSLSILFFSIDVSFDVTWGDKKDTTLPPVDVMPIFVGEINKQSNWKALPPPSTNLLVTLRAVDPSLLVLHPFGSLTLSQRALPLKLKLDKVGNQNPDDVNTVDISSVSSNPGGGAPVTPLTLNDEDEQFAIAQYQDMSDSDKLSRPSYQLLKGGVIIGSSDSMQSSKMTRRTINYNATIIDRDPQQPVFKGRFAALSGLFHPFLSGSAAARSPLSYKGKTQLRPFTDTIAVGQEGYAVSNTSDNKPVNTASSFSSEAMARDYMKIQVASNPSLADGVHVLPNSEVNAS